MTFADKQLEAFKEFLRRTRAPITSPTYLEAIQFVRKFPRALTTEEREELRMLFRQAFQDQEVQILQPPNPFEALIPKKGFFRKYYEYTYNTEPPTVFHFLCAYTILGATMGRRIYFDKGIYKVYPNTAALLIAPTGKCRKTSATNTALSLLRETSVPIFSDRITPEALTQALAEQCEKAGESVGLLYAPELAVFLGKQRYLEGLVPLLTSLFDAPDYWASRTIGRGETKLKDVALSFLGASTLDWFLEAVPHEVYTGGFISRLLIVAQEDTDRLIALPPRPAGYVFEGLREDLLELERVKGEVLLPKSAEEWYTAWYARHHKRVSLNEKQAGYMERKPDHMLRMAMLLALGERGMLEIRDTDFEQALNILDWLEGTHCAFFEAISLTPVHRVILDKIRRAGGRIHHSRLLRLVQFHVSAHNFREAIETLIQAELVREIRTPVEHVYELVVDEKEDT